MWAYCSSNRVKNGTKSKLKLWLPFGQKRKKYPHNYLIYTRLEVIIRFRLVEIALPYCIYSRTKYNKVSVTLSCINNILAIKYMHNN